MENGNMKVVRGEKPVITLKEVPAAPDFMGEVAKKYFISMGEKLVKIDRLRDTFVENLTIWAEAAAQYQFATDEIYKLNRLSHGKGYVQRFPSGARQISPEMTLRDNAAETMIKCSKLFGLDPRSEKELKAAPDQGNQMSWAEEFFNRKNAQ